MNRKNKVYIYPIICVMLIFFCACSSSKSRVSETADIKDGMVLAPKNESYYPFEDGGTVNGVVRLGSTLFAFGQKHESPLLAIANYNIEDDYSVNISHAINLALTDDADEANVFGICAGGDGFFYALTGENPRISYDSYYQTVENPDYVGRYAILKYSSDGVLLDKTKIENWHGNDAIGIAVDDDGEMIIYGSGYISLLDSSGSLIHTEKFDDEHYVQSVTLCGKLFVASVMNAQGALGSFYVVDKQTGTLSELSMPDSGDGNENNALLEGNWSVTQGVDSEYIISNGTAFVGVDFETGVMGKLSKWNFSQNIVTPSYICRLSDSAFIYTIFGDSQLHIYSQIMQPHTERSVVNVALVGKSADYMLSAMEYLNSVNSKYEYVCESFAATELTRLSGLMSTSDSPDLVIFSDLLDYEHPEISLYTGSGMFCDLYDFLDLDTELSRDSFLPNLLDALSVNGKLYELWSTVQITTLYARQSDVGSGKNMTPGDYNRILSENEKYLSIFNTYMSNENLLQWVATLGVSVYTDKGTASADFDNQSFIDILAWCKQMYDDISNNNGSQLGYSYDKSEIILDMANVASPISAHYISVEFGEPSVYVGFPLGETSGSFYTNTGICMAIPTNASNKEGAWDYIRNQLTDESQTEAIKNRYFPVNYDVLRRYCLTVINDDELKVLTDLMENTMFVQNQGERDLQEMIISNAMAYLSGDKTVEDAVAEIQSRASVYMAEKYG